MQRAPYPAARAGLPGDVRAGESVAGLQGDASGGPCPVGARGAGFDTQRLETPKVAFLPNCVALLLSGVAIWMAGTVMLLDCWE